METWGQKLKSRETIIAIVAVVSLLGSLFGFTVDRSQLEEAITGLGSIAILIAVVWNRAVVKRAEIQASIEALKHDASQAQLGVISFLDDEEENDH